MSFKKYKYYFRKPRSAIVKDIFTAVLVVGVIIVAAQSPYFTQNVLRVFRNWKKYRRRKIYDTFYQLRKQGLITITKKNRQIYISLTEKGKMKAGWLQINDLTIKRPSKWDKRWRLLLFDIEELKKGHREALRGKLKELGFIQLQKSIWMHPFDCEAEVELIRDFFGLSEQRCRFVVAEKIGADRVFKEHFKLL